MKKNNLLVITNGFPEIKSERYHCQFVYEQTKLVQNLFDEITVISPQPYFPSFLNKFPRMAGYSKLSGFHDYKAGNMRIYYPTYFTLPITLFREHNNILMAKVIKKIIQQKNIQYDVVHAHFLYPTGEAVLSALPAQIPKVLYLHGGDVYSWATNQKNTERARNIWRAFDSLRIPSKYLASELLRLDPKLDENKIQIIAPSIDKKIFYPKLKRNKEKIVLMVANLVEGKGHLDGLKAFVKLREHGQGVKLKIIGTGPLYNFIKQQIRKMKLEAEVEMVGPVAHTELGKWYRRASVLLFPSYAESFGIVQSEAMACGLPVVAYANEGSREVLFDHPEYLVKIGDIEQLSEKLLQVLYSPYAQPDQIHRKTAKT